MSFQLRALVGSEEQSELQSKLRIDLHSKVQRVYRAVCVNAPSWVRAFVILLVGVKRYQRANH